MKRQDKEKAEKINEWLILSMSFSQRPSIEQVGFYYLMHSHRTHSMGTKRCHGNMVFKKKTKTPVIGYVLDVRWFISGGSEEVGVPPRWNTVRKQGQVYNLVIQ